MSDDATYFKGVPLKFVPKFEIDDGTRTVRVSVGNDPPYLVTMRNAEREFSGRSVIHHDGYMFELLDEETAARARKPRQKWTPYPVRTGALAALTNFFRRLFMSTWKPNNGTDTLAFADINATPGVYGSGSDTPSVITRTAGVSVGLDASATDAGPALTVASFPVDQKFRKLSGTLTTDFVS